MYNVIFRTIGKGTSRGAISWVFFEDKERFNEWYNEEMRGWYQVVEEGVSKERAVELAR